MEHGDCLQETTAAKSLLARELPYLAHFAADASRRMLGATALYIRETGSRVTAEDLLQALGGQLPLRLISYDGTASDQGLIEELAAVLAASAWALLTLSNDLSSRLINMLIRFDRQQTLEVERSIPRSMPGGSRLLVFAEREFIEEQLSFRRFYSIFGMLRRV